jgi:hypothetical protein
MARDLKLVQRGVNVQANDLAVPAGTLLRATNIDFQRDGVAARRAGFDGFYAGLPSVPFDPLRPIVGATDTGQFDATMGDDLDIAGFAELFSRDHAFLFYGGFAFTYDEDDSAWSCVPVSMSHRFTFFGTINGDRNNAGDDLGSEYAASGIGRAVVSSEMLRVDQYGKLLYSPLTTQTTFYNQMYGDVGNAASEAADAVTRRNVRFGQIADAVAFGSGGRIFSDSSANVVWTIGAVLAGSLTASGAINGTGTAATFSGPSWMAFDATYAYVADNTNMVRRVTSAGVVTTLAGSITAGDSNGYFAPAAAQWSNHDATLDQPWGSVAFSPTLGSGSGRVCAIATGVAENEAMTSDDGGQTWTARGLPSTRTWMSVTWAAGLSLFVAVAQDGTVSGRCATSPDGITWTARTTPDGAWASVAWSSSLSRLVAVGLSAGPSYAMTSTDGTTWTTSGVTQINGYWKSVCSAGALGFVAVGQFDTGSGQVMYATTGLNWTAGTVTAANQWVSVSWSGSLLAAVSIDGADRVMTSPDGAAWTARTAAAANQWWGVTWSDAFDVFIAVAIDGANRIMYSRDGTTWTAVAAPDAKAWTAIVDCVSTGFNGVVSTAVADLDSVMRATVVGASVVDGLFRTVSGLAYADGYLYVAESGGNRVRRVTVSTGVISDFVGSTSSVSGSTDGTGTAARFNGPTGIEFIDGDLYVADTGNNSIRKVTTAGVVTTLSISGAGLSSPVLRGRWRPRRTPSTSPSFLVIENTPSSGLIDVYLAEVADTTRAHHVVRCPSAYPDGVSGPNKLDTMGPNLFSLADPRAVDCGNGAAFITSQRPHVIDTDTSMILRPLGIMAPCAPSVTAVAGTTFAAGTAVAYRTVIGLNLPDGRVAFGPPSERVILIGSATATWAGSITAYPAPGLPYNGEPFVQVYRTRSASSITDPGDQMFLCYEGALSYGSGLVVADALPDDLLNAELYTNTTQDGVKATALAPPTFARDVANFNGSAVLGNYVQPASIRLTVLGTGSLVAGTSRFTLTPSPQIPLVLSGVYGGLLTLTAIAGANNPAANEFQIASGGTATENAVQTARNIATVINRSPDAMLYVAQYDESQPGTVVVTSLWPGLSKSRVGYHWNGFNLLSTTTQASIAFSVSSAGVVNSIAATQQSLSTRSQNAIISSEQAALDSFPAVNETTVGTGAEGVVRLLPISDTLIAVKDDSVWSMDAGFEPRIYDKALACSLADSFAMVNNQWIGLFSRGFVALSSAQGVALGRPIDRDVTAQYGQPLDGFTVDRASAAANDLTGNYLCVFNSRAFVYNVVAQAWSDWSVGVVAGDSSGGFEATTAGAYLDTFLLAQNGPRSVLHQRRWQRDGTDFYTDFADPAYSFGVATLAADLQTLTIAAYDATTSAGALPPIVVEPPAGAVSSAGNDSAAFWWVFSCVQGSVTAQAFGTVAVASPSSATSAITITLAEALTTIAAGSVTVTGYPPVICRVQYAPFASPGGNSGFGDILVTLERCQPGWLVGRFFGRQDLGDAATQPIGWYGDAYGVSRAKLMPSITTSGAGVGSLMSYDDAQRFATPRERAVGQTLGLELWEGVAWQPLAIKAVTVDKGDKENSKVIP